MDCPECGEKMVGPTRDYEDVLLNHGKKFYYDMWCCPRCMELVFKSVGFIEPWSVS